MAKELSDFCSDNLQECKHALENFTLKCALYKIYMNQFQLSSDLGFCLLAGRYKIHREYFFSPFMIMQEVLTV